MRRWQIKIITSGKPDKEGKQSLDTHVTHPDCRVSGQTYYANADQVLKRLRHKIAHQYWIDKFRKRMASIQNHECADTNP
jgi:hypothetical protein